MQPGYAAVRHYSGVLPSPDKQKRQRVLPFYGGRRGIRLTAIADRECQGRNRVQPGYAAVRHYSGVLLSPDKQKGNGCCLFMAEGEGFEPPDTFASTVFKFYPASVACRLLVLFNSPNCRKISVLTALLSDNSGFLLCFSIVPRSLLLLIFNAFLTAFCRWFVDGLQMNNVERYKQIVL